ncbi:hypothetical protein [Treponema socranskii]|uniref:hypothetical protein n=1 Tax=Treponema socranskii TaxID=53419 RepID=UPI003D6E9262
MIFTGIAAGLSALIGAGVGIYNAVQQQKKMSYDKGIQQDIFNREDNAVVRRAADLEAAGMSKTLAAGSAANAGVAVPVQAPHVEGSQMDAAMNALAALTNVAQIRKLSAETQEAQANTTRAVSQGKLFDAQSTAVDSQIAEQLAKAYQAREIGAEASRRDSSFYGSQKDLNRANAGLSRSNAALNRIHGNLYNMQMDKLSSDILTAQMERLMTALDINNYQGTGFNPRYNYGNLGNLAKMAANMTVGLKTGFGADVYKQLGSLLMKNAR